MHPDVRQQHEEKLTEYIKANLASKEPVLDLSQGIYDGHEYALHLLKGAVHLKKLIIPAWPHLLHKLPITLETLLLISTDSRFGSGPKHIPLTDFTFLRALTQLKALGLDNQDLTDVRFLQHLPNLELLNLSDNKQLRDIGPLQHLKKLKGLFLAGTSIRDLSPLRGLTQLGLLDFTVLMGATTSLHTSGLGLHNHFQSLTPLSGLTNLHDLKIDGHFLQNIQALVDPDGSLQKRLDLAKAHLADLRTLKNLKNLQNLQVSNFNIHDISPLSGLTKLETLHLGHNQIQHLAPLKFLLQLQILNLSHNRIQHLPEWSDLQKLETLDLSHNQLRQVASLKFLMHLKHLTLKLNRIQHLPDWSDLQKLETLDLSQNQLTDITPLQKLTQLKKLNLEQNQITHIPPRFFEQLPYLESLNLRKNPVANVPPEVFKKGKCSVDELHQYFADLNQGVAKVHQTKLILIGNGGVGKTSLVRRWLDGGFDAHEPSTHAIQLRPHYLPTTVAQQMGKDQVRLQIWDFGGQDIYHSTHQLFMQTNAVFVLVWDVDTEEQEKQEEVLENGTPVTYYNHPLPYWLDYVRYLGNSSPVLVVQTKRDVRGKQLPQNWNELLKAYPNIAEGLSVELKLDDEDDNGVGVFKEQLYKVLRQQSKKVQYQLPKSWWQVRLELEMRQHDQTRTLTLDQFSQICKKVGVVHQGHAHLREYFHHTGALFYQEGLFKNELIVDQKWAIEAVYTLLDRQGLLMRLQRNGFFRGQDLIDRWDELARAQKIPPYTPQDQAQLVLFMESCHICVEIGKNARSNSSSLPLAQRQYLAPQLLPDTAISNQASLFRSGTPSVFVKLVHPFLHAAVMQQFMIRTTHLVEDKQSNIRQNSIYLKYKKHEILVQAIPAEKSIVVQLAPNPKYLGSLKTVINSVEWELKQARQGLEGVQKWVSCDGQGYIRWEALQNHPPRNPDILGDNGRSYSITDFAFFGFQATSVKKSTTSPPTNLPQAIEAALAYLEQDNIPGYFEVLSPMARTPEQENQFNSFQKEYERGRYNHDFEGRLRVFAQGLEKGK